MKMLNYVGNTVFNWLLKWVTIRIFLWCYSKMVINKCVNPGIVERMAAVESKKCLDVGDI